MCRQRPKVLKVDWAAGLNPKGAPATRIVSTLARPLGLEVELSVWGTVPGARGGHHTCEGVVYQCAHDGSVLPSQLEMVLPPLAGDAFLITMVKLGAALARHKAEVNKSCGLHVHVAGADLSYWDIRRLLTVYAALEDQIFNVLCVPYRSSREARERKRSNGGLGYCNPLTNRGRQIIAGMWKVCDTNALKAQLYWLLYNNINPKSDRGEALATMKREKYVQGTHHDRYQALNLHTWMQRSTVEFRHKEGTLDVQEMVCWGLWCGHFVEVCTRISDAQARNSCDLLAFTTAHMPAFVAEWVKRKAKGAPTAARAPAATQTNVETHLREAEAGEEAVESRSPINFAGLRGLREQFISSASWDAAPPTSGEEAELPAASMFRQPNSFVLFNDEAPSPEEEDDF